MAEKPVVLVVDDDRPLCEHIKEVFEEEGYEVATATNYHKAVRIIHQLHGKIVVAFVDIDALPGKKSGIDLLTYTSQYAPHVVAYGWTKHPDRRLRIEAIWAGAIGYFVKPLDHVELLVCVKAPVVRRLVTRSLYDSLTGFLHHDVFNDMATRQLLNAGSRRHPEVLSMLLIDVDHFKSINDTYGHATGDNVLQLIAGIILNHLRSSDLAGRWGGDEFVILLPEVGEEAATKVARTMEESVEVESAKLTAFAEVKIPISISVGVAVMHCEAPQLFTELFNRADKAMYKDKEAKKLLR